MKWLDTRSISIAFLTALLLLSGSILGMSPACAAGKTDVYLKQLGDDDPDVRARAAYELGCG
jgi:hypothetical protein